MDFDGFPEGDVVIKIPKEGSGPRENRSIEGDIIRIILSDLHELKIEVITLQREVIKNNQRIAQLENREKPYGSEIHKRVYSMLKLINDYGGSMTSTDVKKIMGLSKDEFYRTVRCAKDESLIVLTPNAKDLRCYTIKIKSE
jgi:hypothetical protein